MYGYTDSRAAGITDTDDYVLSDSPITAQALYLLSTHFKDIPSLQKIVINFEVYPGQEPSRDSTMIHDCGWTVKVTELPKKTWISDDRRVELDTYKEYQAYNEEQLDDLFWKNDLDYD